MTINDLIELNKFDNYSGSNDDKWIIIREYRNQLLDLCDWTQLPDAPMTPEKKQEWIVYRQELRDITDNFTNPDDVIFPEIPE